MRIVVALGGNALLERGERPTHAAQRAHVELAATCLAPLAAEHELVVTHGNGPQVGFLDDLGSRFGLDVIGAETEGMIGYALAQALDNHVLGADVATLLTQTVVDPADPAFAHPTKPVGALYTARHLARQAHRDIAPDGGGWRRVVPSPEPLEIVELSTIRLLVEAGVVVVCTGGGGIPVARGAGGALRGVEAVVDKDLASALLAQGLGADLLVMLTDVAAVELDRDTAHPRALGYATADTLRALDLPAGSMGPKAEAAARFVEGTGRRAAIGALGDAAEVVAGAAGTQVGPAPVPVLT